MGFLALDYHYIHQKEQDGVLRKIYAVDKETFANHLNMAREHCTPITIDDVERYYYDNIAIGAERLPILFTFDDGLADHFEAAHMLHQAGIRGVFYIPTCVVRDHLPANPIIIHFGIAIHGITTFLQHFHTGLNIFAPQLMAGAAIQYEKGADDPNVTIGKIKSVLKKTIPHQLGRQILIHIYENLILNGYPRALEMMHLTTDQIEEMLRMGHAIGAHSHSHLSIGASALSAYDYQSEIIEPRRYLEKRFNTKVNSLAYPFGLKEDSLDAAALKKIAGEYKLAFTIEKIFNTSSSNPLGLGRYDVWPSDNSEELWKKLKDISKK